MHVKMKIVFNTKSVCCVITVHKHKEEHCWTLRIANFRDHAGIRSQCAGIRTVRGYVAQ